MYQQRIKSPAWEVERVEDDKVTFSARNSGCADFITIPISLIAEEIVRKGILVKCDEMEHFI